MGLLRNWQETLALRIIEVERGKRLPFVPVVNFIGVAGSRPPGEEWRQRGGIAPANHNLCNFGVFIGRPGHST